MTTRRNFIAGVGATAATAALAACSSSATTASRPTADDTSPVTMRFAWWGNDIRNKNTAQVIADYMKLHPNVTITGEPGVWGSYWDKLSTQVAGSNAPDIVQMDEQYIRDYSKKGILADLSKLPIDTSKFAKGLVATGTIDSKVTALCAGVNALSIVANPDLFKQAGIEMPDDKTWTWDKLQSVAAELTTKLGAGKYGINGGIFGDSTARAWMFQHGKSLYTDTGFGFEPADMQSFLELMLKFSAAKATPSAAEQAQDYTTALAQQLFGTGKTAMGLTWSNQIAAQQAATGKDLKIMRLPSVDGTAKGASLWYKSGQYQSITAKSKNQVAAAKFLDYFFNNADAGKVMLAERGLPPNTDILAGIKGGLGNADQKAATYMSDIAGDLHDAPVPPPPGASTFQAIMQRHVENVLFGKAAPAAAAKAMYDEAKAQLKS